MARRARLWAGRSAAESTHAAADFAPMPATLNTARPRHREHEWGIAISWPKSLFACRTATSPNSVQSCASNAAQLGRSWGGAGPGDGPQAGTGGLALARLEAPLRLIDDVDPPLTPHDAVVAVAAAERFQ